MKKLLIMIMCFIVLTGCTTLKYTFERDYEIYEKGYEEGYNDAIEATIDQMPWYLIDKEEFEDVAAEFYAGLTD